jgi:hypothetical protein
MAGISLQKSTMKAWHATRSTVSHPTIRRLAVTLPVDA